MQRHIILTISFLLILIQTGRAQEIKKDLVFFELKSQKVLSVKQIKDKTANKTINKFILNYWDKGYISLSIDTLINSKYRDTLKFELGKRYYWNNIRYKNIPKEIIENLKAENTFSHKKGIRIKNYNTFMLKLLQYYEDNGYPFAQISLDSVRIDSNQISAIIQLQKNTFYQIDSIKIVSQSPVNKKYLANVLEIEEGIPYNESLVQKIDKRIKNNLYYTAKKPAEIVFRPNSCQLILYLEKNKVSQFNGVVGILPNDKDDGGLSITGDISLYLANSFNKAEVIDLQWKRVAEASQELNLEAAYPYLFNTDFGLDGRLYIYKQDSSFLNVEQQIGAFYQASYTSIIKVFINKKSSSPLSSETQNNQTAFQDVDILYFGGRIEWNKTDSRIVPTKGFTINFEGKGGNKKTTPHTADTPASTDKQTQFILNLETMFYTPIYRRFIYHSAIRTGSMIDNSLYKNEIFRLGGTKLLRGFDEKSIYASDYSVLTNEIRYMLESRSFLFLFADYSWYQSRVTQLDYIRDTPIGIGAGISFETKAGIFALSYAVGKQFDNPFDLRAAKVHFGLNAYF